MVLENPMFRIAWKNFRRRRIRSVITILSIMLAIACFVVIVSVEDTISAQITSFYSGRQGFPFFGDFIVVEANRWVRAGLRLGRAPETLVEELTQDELVDTVAVRIGTPDPDGEQLLLKKLFGEGIQVFHTLKGQAQTQFDGFPNLIGIDPVAESKIRTPRINQTTGLPYWDSWQDINRSIVRGIDATLSTGGVVNETGELNGELSYALIPAGEGEFELSVFGMGVDGSPSVRLTEGGSALMPGVGYETALGVKRNYTIEFILSDYDEVSNEYSLDYRLWFGYYMTTGDRRQLLEITTGRYLEPDPQDLPAYGEASVYPALIGVDLAEDPGMRISSVGVEDGDLIMIPKGTEGSNGGAVAEDVYLRVIGVFISSHRRDNSNIYVHYEHAREMLRISDTFVQEAIVTVEFEGDDNAQRVERTAELAEKVASQRDMNTRIPRLSIGEEGGKRVVAEQVKTTQLAHLQSVLITLVVAVIVVMNATVLSIYERVREVGIMGAMGSEVWHIMDMYVFELMIIGLIGGIGGYIVGTLIALGTRLLPNIPNIALKLNPLWIMAAVSIGTLVSVAAGVFPARLAGTLDPIKAIAGEWAISPTEGRIFGTISRMVKRSYYSAMASRNLGKRKLRSILTSLGITVGIAMLVNLLVISAFQRQLTPGYSIEIYQVQVVAFAILVGALGITNAMLTSVLERTKEIGIMVAVGATPGEVMKVFLSEAGIIGVIGGVLGSILGTVTSLVFFVGREGLSLPVSELAVGWLAGIFLAVAVAVIAGIYPSRRAAKMEPVEAFMYEW